MSGDEKNDVSIPVVFMFSAEAKVLTDYMDAHEDLQVYLARTAVQDRGESRQRIMEGKRKFLRLLK